MTDDNEFPGWIDDARTERESLRKSSPELFATVSTILFECDPIGINFGDNTDEYDAEAGSIIPRLSECTTHDDARRVIYEEFSKWFSGTAGDESRYDDAAKKIWAVWMRHIAT